MFQSGPNHPWLMKVYTFICSANFCPNICVEVSWKLTIILLQIYSKTVGYPFASSLAQEIFQSGFIPGDTDYRIFRDFGGVPGKISSTF